VIQNMILRANERRMDGLRYLQADACTLPPAMKSYTCRAIIDKGTLDAIASGGTEPQSGPALRYLREMWRVLAPGGRFLIISTMPPKLFDLLAVSVVRSKDYSSAPLRTPEGGEVFLFSIKKPIQERSSLPSPLASSPGDIIESLLREAADAQRELEEIRKKVYLPPLRPSLPLPGSSSHRLSTNLNSEMRP
jgi:SAM-dependent methyltransferase